MARTPDAVIIARHGARLDAADKTWHLGSPTPYDPPLTYGGWSQGKALGLRIAALLDARQSERAADDAKNQDLAHLEFSSLDAKTSSHGSDGLARPAKKHKIVIHSSPYLRCIQTSTAIAAGISQYQPPATSRLKVPYPAKERNGVLGHSPLAKSPAVQPSVLEPAADPNLHVFPKKPHTGPDKILLRIDAFLGEWLSPDYFEDITPPPNSTMMVAGAKADLLRRGDYVEIQPTTHSSKGHFPGGWVKSNAPSNSSSRKNSEDGPSFPTMGSLAQALPLRERASSQSSAMAHTAHTSRAHHKEAPLSTAHKVPSHIYDPPVPSYAVSSSEPIPRGYVAHARDACVEVDYQWDSMRAPQEWGDGGEYGDEWSTMHKRFRKGLAGMMSWYKEHGSMPPKDQLAGFTYREHAPPVMHHASDPGPLIDTPVEDDEELVLVLVTHGAGCNALLGAITNQPVLLDVGLAALSMAVRRDEPRKPSVASIPQRRSSVVDIGMEHTYDMKMLASVDHLRPGVDPSKPPQIQPQSPANTASPSFEYRRRFTNSSSANSPIDSPLMLAESYHRTGWNSSLGSIRRSSTSGSGSGSRYASSNLSGGASPSASLGLWSGSNLRPHTSDTSNDPGRKSPGHDMVLNFGNQQPTTTNNKSSTTKAQEPTIPQMDGAANMTNGKEKPHHQHNSNSEENEKVDQVAPLRSVSGSLHRSSSSSTSQSVGSNGGGLWGGPKPQPKTTGLWGPPKLDDVYEHGRGPKRRWTVTDRD